MIKSITFADNLLDRLSFQYTYMCPRWMDETLEHVVFENNNLFDLAPDKTKVLQCQFNKLFVVLNLNGVMLP